jgi:hypothetical protein
MWPHLVGISRWPMICAGLLVSLTDMGSNSIQVADAICKPDVSVPY